MSDLLGLLLRKRATRQDRTIRVWDASTRAAIHTFRREHDRFWCIDQHPTKSLLAVRASVSWSFSDCDFWGHFNFVQGQIESWCKQGRQGMPKLVVASAAPDQEPPVRAHQCFVDFRAASNTRPGSACFRGDS